MTQPGAQSPQAVLVDWLARQGVEAEIRQTHASVVAITAERVFKMKKPVRYPFLDLSTVALRLRVCERELELNRRLAPDVYLKIVPITDAAGTVVDHAVEMVRLPDADRLDTLVADQPPDTQPPDTQPPDTQRPLSLSKGRAEACIAAVADRMARFHAGADRSPQIDAVAEPEAMVELWRAELDGLRPYSGSAVEAEVADEAEQLALRYVAGRAPLFAARIAAGCIVDGHGDLRADDVFCMPNGLRIIDCLEFDDRLRWGDVLADVAFLAMDLEWLGRPDLAGSFLTQYVELSRGQRWPATLAAHWIGYRAHVRAKVACLRVVAGNADARTSATGHLALAVRHLRNAQVRLVLVGGLPGTGKTTLARAIARRDPEVVVLRSDVVRGELSDPEAGSPERGYGTGRYAPAAVDRVYEELSVRAQQPLAMGRPVVLDASWSSEQQRARARRLAERAGAVLVELCCQVPEQVAEERLRRRAREGTDESQADAAVARAMATRFDPWPQARAVDTRGDAETIARELLDGL